MGAPLTRRIEVHTDPGRLAAEALLDAVEYDGKADRLLWLFASTADLRDVLAGFVVGAWTRPGEPGAYVSSHHRDPTELAWLFGRVTLRCMSANVEGYHRHHLVGHRPDRVFWYLAPLAYHAERLTERRVSLDVEDVLNGRPLPDPFHLRELRWVRS